MNTWIHDNKALDSIPDDFIGFIYRITNTKNGREYIGKKNFYATQTRQKTVVLKSTGLKKKKKIRSQIESDWKEYHGSSDDLKKDVELLGADCFTREILHLCKTKGEMSYMESKTQFVEDVLLYPTKYYNSWIQSKIHRSHIKHMVHPDSLS